MEIIRRRNEIFSENVKTIIYVYGVDTVDYHKMKNENPDILFVTKFEEENIPRNSLVIFDDRMSEIISQENSAMSTFVTRTVHHKNCSAIIILQNIFAPKLRTITLNAQYLMFFKTPRDNSCVSHLSRQIFPGKNRFLTECYEIATKKPHSYLFVDLHQLQNDSFRVRTNIFYDIDCLVLVS